MIKINLGHQSKKNKLMQIPGIDLSLINFKMILLSLITLLLPSLVDQYLFTARINQIEKESKKIENESAAIKFDLNDRNIDQKLADYNKQTEMLKMREKQVEEILKKNSNPMQMLVHIAKSIPKNVWIETLKINSNDISLKVKAENSESFSEFRNKLNGSIYFEDSIKIDKTESQNDGEGDKSVRIDVFELTGLIKRFN